MNAHQAKQIPIVEVLKKLGYTPVRKDKGGREWVYNSPFRAEKVPSFFVNIHKNVWNDFGDSGGNILDFVIKYKNIDFKAALIFLRVMYHKEDFKPLIVEKTALNGKLSAELTPQLTIDYILPLKSPILEKYLKERAIDINIARKFLKVVQFRHIENGQKYFGLGLPNLSDGYEIRNSKFKSVIGKKDISFISGPKNTTNIFLFESFIDFLSFATKQKKSNPQSDILILNSTKLIEKAKAFIQTKNYKNLYVFFDNDDTGNQALKSLFDLKQKIIPCNHLYQNFKDYNEFWQNESKK